MQGTQAPPGGPQPFATGLHWDFAMLLLRCFSAGCATLLCQGAGAGSGSRQGWEDLCSHARGKGEQKPPAQRAILI